MSFINVGNPQSIKYRYFSANTPGTLVKASPGVLQRVILGVAGAATNRLSLYDSVLPSGPLIAVINTSVGTGGSVEIGVEFTAGLTVVIAGGTTAPQLTCIYS